MNLVRHWRWLIHGIEQASTEAAAQAAANVPVQTLTRDVLSPEPYPSEDQPPTPGDTSALAAPATLCGTMRLGFAST